MYNEKYAKTKIRSYESRINTNFHDNEMSKEGFHCISLSVILIVFKMGKNYYPQEFLEVSPDYSNQEAPDKEVNV